MKLYNSATRTKEEFVPNHPDIVKMYTCGPTVYHYAHIGNLRSYIMEDVLEKYLRYLGYNVKRVMNITDVGHLTSRHFDCERLIMERTAHVSPSYGLSSRLLSRYFAPSIVSFCCRHNSALSEKACE